MWRKIEWNYLQGFLDNQEKMLENMKTVNAETWSRIKKDETGKLEDGFCVNL